MSERKLANRKKQLNLGTSQDLVDGLNEVILHLKSRTNNSINITRTDALRYLLKVWRDHKKKYNS